MVENAERALEKHANSFNEGGGSIEENLDKARSGLYKLQEDLNECTVLQDAVMISRAARIIAKVRLFFIVNSSTYYKKEISVLIFSFSFVVHTF